MSFFGMTALADGSLETVFKRFKARQLCLKDVTDEEFEALFDKYSVKKQPTLLTHTMNSGKLKLDPDRTMMRCDMPKILRDLLGGRDPSNEEMDAFLTFFNTDTGGCIALEEYRFSYRAFKKRSSDPHSAVNYTSTIHLWDDRKKERRPEHGPQDTYQRPMTTAQEIGWTAVSPPSIDPLCLDSMRPQHNPMPSTDVTRGEGRSVTDYFL